VKNAKEGADEDWITMIS